MMEVIDFTDLKKRNKTYSGANGNKISVIYEGEQYMLKFPVQAKMNRKLRLTGDYAECKIRKGKNGHYPG